MSSKLICYIGKNQKSLLRDLNVIDTFFYKGVYQAVLTDNWGIYSNKGNLNLRVKRGGLVDLKI